MKSGENGLIGPGDNDYGRKDSPNEVKPLRKPIVAKPQFYAVMFPALQTLAREMGYNLLIHGSLNRDMDLVAVAWTDDPVPELELIQALDKYLTGRFKSYKEQYLFSILPGGRKSYVINLHRELDAENNWEDPMYYLDISVTPTVK